ncbi:NADP-dependent phosphogluconate dehydrogenase [Amaricoccus sp.]|uniref:NADP-dependent phosphogluconate dehydrogenase n=1 Tax=Amaricoccus sp. TaxID=1872485 RepID=UPI001B5856AE|nr:NADP-dependent phosphogluconate dehydrogenase [Amaricoccus sp.]MBP7240462.1 NADP-dependent phosphogluconate dehydrogenase [Amaricoccus sp.]
MSESRIGLVGLGTMGGALALNIAEKGFDIAVWNRTAEVTRRFHAGAGDLAARITPTETLAAFVAALARPRAIILMVPAGRAVDEQIAALRPLLDPEDLIIDAGNANFHDTDRRSRDGGGAFLGMGVSGGEEGARHGPSIMGGGRRADWDRVAPVLEAIAAQHEGEPCAAWLGEEGAGHFVKTVHNGIEYADMQMIAEIYGVLRDGLGRSAAEIGATFERWNRGRLQSYLVEITGKVAGTIDPQSGGPLLDVIVDAAGQKGTGRWTAIEAQHLAVPVPAIEAAVAARNLSAARAARREAEAIFGAGPRRLAGGALDEATLERALVCGKALCYAQGFEMIAAASREFGWLLPLPLIARIWRAGCIIRSAMLDDMASALAEAPDRNLIFAPFFAGLVKETHGALREVVAAAALNGLATPALASGVAYFDALRTARGTANMIQGQRDFFGLHGFARLDDGRTGQHGPWAG